jgi:ABC-type sulfate/molybdate transport systems ATPase subunit
MARLDIDIKTGLRAFDLELTLGVEAETLALVGPSGSGKTTLLRAVAGLHRPDSGHVTVAGRPWFDAERGVDLRPEERSVGMVFQDYALFPHMSVRANVAFGGGEDMADSLLRRFRIERLAGQRPGAISGGERQRVALARALARRPDVLLLDEPLSALDPHTRSLLRGELRDALCEAGLPAVLVTHDFREAAALAERIAVLAEGRILQVGTAGELIDRPADALVAVLAGAVVLDGRAVEGGVLVDGGVTLPLGEPVAGPVQVALLPWLVELSRSRPDGGRAIKGRVSAVASEGSRTTVEVAGLTSEQPSHVVEPMRLAVGEEVWVDVPPTAVKVLRHGAV